MGFRWRWISVLVLSMLAGPAPAGAADQTVSATPSNQFVPRSVTVDIGDTVTWNNTGGFHDVVFDDGSFSQPSPPSGNLWSVSRDFSAPGTFGYYCSIHGGPNGLGMSGAVTVNAGGLDAKLIRAPLALAYEPCTEAAANRVHAEPLDFPACSPPEQVSDFLTVGTFGSNRRVTNSVGSVRVRMDPGDPGTPADEANVALIASITDVRARDDLSDYTGELEAVLPLRITDSNNGPSANEKATGDTSITFPIPCAENESPDAGSDCAVTTTVDAVSPGAVVEGKQATWEVDAVKVFDGGADGVASTAGNTLFMAQSLFVP